MKRKRLDRKNALHTPNSATTVMINYSKPDRILEVEFTGGRTYHYYHVEPEIWEQYKDIVQSGGSSGNFVNTAIKPNYPDPDEVF